MIKNAGIFLLSLTVVGCSWRAESLRQQPLTHAKSVSLDTQTDKRFLIYPFDDLRGGEYAHVYPSSYILVANLFHLGGYNRYPEQAGILRASRGGRPVVSVGSLDAAMPFLIATMMREMKFTANATPLESVNARTSLQDFDYVIRGNVKKTKYKSQTNIIPLAILGLLGTPYMFTNFEIEYEVLLFEPSDLSTPLHRETYTFEDSTPVGLYYNSSAAFDMFIAGLETTIPDVVSDIADAVRAKAQPTAAAPMPMQAAPPVLD